MQYEKIFLGQLGTLSCNKARGVQATSHILSSRARHCWPSRGSPKFWQVRKKRNGHVKFKAVGRRKSFVPEAEGFQTVESTTILCSFLTPGSILSREGVKWSQVKSALRRHCFSQGLADALCKYLVRMSRGWGLLTCANTNDLHLGLQCSGQRPM